MQINIFANPEQNGLQAALASQKILLEAIEEQGSARLVLSTGASQFDFFKHFVTMDIPWDRVEMFHLDEYIGLPESHPASFRKYLKERFLAFVQVKAAHLVNGEGNIEEELRSLNAEVSKAPIDLALIGIGENTHIAFNDPPANFELTDPYTVLELDDTCKQQQVREGWFATIDDVPKSAITMSVQQILKSRHIISVVPYEAKAAAVYQTLTQPVDPEYPATILKSHSNWSLYLDQNSASRLLNFQGVEQFR
ncbi:MAG: glucosamine-6-phosphate deaminase [Firmicutes bacterium]|nr:glucosamine-6-phosphate deaminase [Bacillota bacterium]